MVVVTSNSAWAGSSDNPFEKAGTGVQSFLTGPIAMTLAGIAMLVTLIMIGVGKATWGTLGNIGVLVVAYFSVGWFLGKLTEAISGGG